MKTIIVNNQTGEEVKFGEPVTFRTEREMFPFGKCEVVTTMILREDNLYSFLNRNLLSFKNIPDEEEVITKDVMAEINSKLELVLKELSDVAATLVALTSQNTHKDGEQEG